MTFRLYTMVVILLLSTMVFAQASPPAATPQMSSPAPGGPYPALSKAGEARGRQIFEMWNSGQTGALWALFAENLKKNSGGEAKFAAYSKALRERMGTETKMLNEDISPVMLMPGTVYNRLSQYSKIPTPVVTTIAIDERGQVLNLVVGPEQGPPEGRYAGYKDTAKLRLPFNGEWFVAQGGHTVFENNYMQSDEQKFALDFVLLKSGRAYTVDSSANESFYCFGQPILAPADGTVIKVEDGYVDNPPGKPSNDSPHGNLIVISHGNKEFSSIDHLKQNSAKVKRGDAVRQGDPIAECGNSGNSPGPHVHFQFQNTAGFPTPDPLPAQFNNYIANGKPVAVGEPVKGQTVSNAPTTGGNPPASKDVPKPAPVTK